MISNLRLVKRYSRAKWLKKRGTGWEWGAERHNSTMREKTKLKCHGLNYPTACKIHFSDDYVLF